MQRHLRQLPHRTLVFILTSFLLFGCNTREPEKGAAESSLEKENYDVVAEIKRSARELSSVIGKRSSELQDTASEELKDLLAVEYKVVDIPIDQSKDGMQEELSSLGRERWNCFHVVRESDYVRLICKRLPPSYLKLVPLLF